MNESQLQNKTQIFFNSDIWGQWQVDDLAYQLATTEGEIELIINSPGGDVFTGTALASLVSKAIQNGRKVTTTGISKPYGKSKIKDAKYSTMLAKI